MKRSLLLLTGFLCLSTFELEAQTVYPSGVSGCVARWTFDNEKGSALQQITDESGNNNHGINYDITAADGWKGLQNTAGRFNGTSSYSRVPFSNMGTSQVTAIALIKFDNFYDGVCQGNSIIYNGFNYNADLNWALFSSDHNYDNDCYSYNPTKNKPNFATPNFINNGVPATDFIQSGEWYFIASAYDGNSIRYYQIKMDIADHVSNVAPSYTENNGGGVGNGNYDIYIGATQNPPFPYWFNGVMDEVILFNKALTNNEIQSVYDYLFGFTTSISNRSGNEKNIFVKANNGQCIINTTGSAKFSYEIYNSLGQIVSKKNNCSSTEAVDLSHQASQMFFVKVLDEKNNIHNFKVNLHN